MEELKQQYDEYKIEASKLIKDLININNDLKRRLSKYEVIDENKNIVEYKTMEDIKTILKNEVKYYKNIDGTFKLDEDGNKIPKKPRSDKTINDYMNILKRAGITKVEEIEKLNNVESMVENVKSRVQASRSQTLQYSAFISILEALKIYPDALNKYRKLQEEGNKQYTEDNASKTLSKKQEEQFATKEEFDGMVNKMQEEFKLNKTPSYDDIRDFQDLLLMKLYQVYPVRNEIADLIKITKEEYDKLETKNKNYLVVDNVKMFISLNDYKTASTYGENLLKLPVDIRKLFRNWFKYYNPHHNHVFMKMNGDKINRNYLTQTLVRITEKNLGRKISTTMIRKIYASDKYADKNEEQEKDSKMMGHSTANQNKVYVKKKS
jgi:hypothetical protein